MSCPVCGCTEFFIKDSEDEFEIYEFEMGEAGIEFQPDALAAGCPDPDDETETFCKKCSWHGSFRELGK